MTVMINLLPWREELREELKKQFFVMLGIAAIASIFVTGCVHIYYQNLVSAQIKSNSYLEQEIKKLDDRIKQITTIREEKDQLLARMEVIQQLQRNRPNVVLLFDSLARVVPNGVNYLSLKRTNEMLEVEGIAESNTRVSKLMRNMEVSDVLKEPTLVIIKENEVGKQVGKYFSLKVSQQLKKE